MKYSIILQSGDYALLDARYEYIFAYGFNNAKPEGKQWEHGAYFTHGNHSEKEKEKELMKAIDYFRIKTEREYISINRFDEIATNSLHALIEDDYETAMEYFEQELKLTKGEREYFWINTARETE